MRRARRSSTSTCASRRRGSRAPTSALFREVLAGIGERCDAIVQPTTGGGVGMTIDERARVVTECRPEMATFNCGSFNFGIFKVRHRPEMAPWEVEYLEGTRDYVFRNTFADMERLSELFREAGTKPEYEVYDVGHLTTSPTWPTPGWSTSRSTSSSCSACSAPTPPLWSSSSTCTGPRRACSATGSRGARPASATRPSSTSRPRR